MLRTVVLVFVAALVLAANTIKPVAATSSQPLNVDRQSQSILDAVAAKLRNTPWLVAKFTAISNAYDPKAKVWSPSDPQAGEVDLGKPNLVYVHSWSVHQKAQGTPAIPVPGSDAFEYCDGTTEWDYWDQKRKYYSKNTMLDTPSYSMANISHLKSFFDQNPHFADLAGWPSATQIHYVGTSKWNGADYRVLNASGRDVEGGVTIDDDTRVYIGSDNLPHRVVTHAKYSDGSIYEDDFQLTTLQTPASLPAHLFVFTPPPGATQKDN